MMRRRRVAAFFVDWCCMLGWAAVVAAAGVPLFLSGIVRLEGVLAENLAGLAVVGPVVLGAAWCESRPRAATPGKRVLGLHVDHAGTPPSFLRALLRNAVKIGLPWMLSLLTPSAATVHDQLSGTRVMLAHQGRRMSPGSGSG